LRKLLSLREFLAAVCIALLGSQGNKTPMVRQLTLPANIVSPFGLLQNGSPFRSHTLRIYLTWTSICLGSILAAFFKVISRMPLSMPAAMLS